MERPVQGDLDVLEALAVRLPPARSGPEVAPPRYGRYIFSNRSEQIHELFTDTLDTLGLHWTRANFKDTAVARQRDVHRLDHYIGPKD